MHYSKRFLSNELSHVAVEASRSAQSASIDAVATMLSYQDVIKTDKIRYLHHFLVVDDIYMQNGGERIMKRCGRPLPRPQHSLCCCCYCSRES